LSNQGLGYRFKQKVIMKIYVYKTTRFGRVDYKPACTISSLVCEWRDSASLTPKDLQFLKILGYEAVEKAVAKKD
jgi:hypothetical protein